MRKLPLIGYLILVVFIIQVNADPSTGELYPEIEPYKNDYLQVSDLHQLYYECCGNPKGKPVFVLHGGPGSGCSTYMRRFFNPDKFNIILHDQRGAKRSKPFAEIEGNTTWNLVEDIEKLRTKLDLNKIILFGGSWGSTLALAYAETYPDNVAGIVLRGVFLGTKSEINHFYHGGVRKHFPKIYDNFVNSLPNGNNGKIPAQLFNLINIENNAQKEKYARIWAKYELQIASLKVEKRTDEEWNKIFNSFNPIAFSLLENYYMKNDCFLKPNQLLKNISKIGSTRVIIVNGRYDAICPPITAYKLHQALENSRLIIAEESGHWMGEENIEKALLKTMQEFE
ncbi:MAG: prolyl aminopeptidase [Candidatus Marinimicrobia bacterium]|nr:prolyl aminopeptidase [Candidatus Neomarinimicrobiota bacterium]